MKKILAIILVAIMVMSVMAVGAGAAEATSTNPANINGETTYFAKPFVSFDEEGIEARLEYSSTSTNNGCQLEIVDGIGVKGKALKMLSNPDAGRAEGYISFEEVDASAFDGIMYYLDMSSVQLDADLYAQKGQTNAMGIRLFSSYAPKYTWTRNTDSPAIEGYETKAYYLADGTTEWKVTDYATQELERPCFPPQFKGWIYIPFTSYISRAGAEGVPALGFYGSEAFTKIMYLSGCYKPGDANVFIFDEFQLVKLGQTTDPTPTEAPDTDPPVTDAPTEAPTDAPTAAPTDAPTEALNTDAPATEAPAKKGCGSSITVASVAVVMTAVLGSACVIKKRKK